MKRALVLGAGGVVGIAWEIGLLEGLLAAGIDARRSDLIIGTSAGSLVGARLAHGVLAPGADLARLCVAPPVPEAGFDLAAQLPVFTTWIDPALEADPEARARRVFELARKSPTASEAAWKSAVDSAAHGLRDWPAQPLRIAAVDGESGRRTLLGPRDAALADAIRASCSLPGICPATSIAGRFYVDGALASATSADAAAEIEPDQVLVIAPIIARTSYIGAVSERCLQREVTALQSAGARVDTVHPDDADIAAFGTDLMDSSRVSAAHEVGRKRGESVAAALRGRW